MDKIGTEIWDWKEQPSIRELNKILKPYGILLRTAKITSGHDSYGFDIYKIKNG